MAINRDNMGVIGTKRIETGRAASLFAPFKQHIEQVQTRTTMDFRVAVR
jgi:hypothetical protein